MPWRLPSGHGGNGGLSLRNPRVMKEICSEHQFDTSRNEDVWYCEKMFKLGYKIAPEHVCKRFACESVFKLGTCGYHQIDAHLSANQVEEIITQYG